MNDTCKEKKKNIICVVCKNAILKQYMYSSYGL